MVRFYRLSMPVFTCLLAGWMALAGAVFAQEQPGAAQDAAQEQPGAAQEQPDAAGDYRDWGEAEELVVTASRTEEDPLSAPAFVTVITADEIARSGAASVVDVLETVPGVRFADGMAGPGSEAVSMRGFGENSHGRVLVLLDGKRLNNPDMQGINWNAVPLAAVERIEVLDGGGSVAYGNNAVGGVINIITKKAGERRTTLEVAGGSFLLSKDPVSLFKAAISHFGPVPWGGFSLSAEHTETDGYRERQGARVTHLSGGVDIDISDTVRLSVSASFADLFYQLPGGLTKAQFEDDPTQAVNREDETSERDVGGGASLQLFPSDSLEITVPFSYMGKFIRSDMASSPSYTNRNTSTFEARPQVTVNTGVAGMPLRLLGGVDFSFARLDIEAYGDKGRKTKSPNANPVITEWTLGPYLTARFDVLPILSVSAGVRYDTANIAAEEKESSIDESKQHSAFVYDAGVVLKPLPALKVYAKYATLFRYPFVDEQAEVSGYGINKFNDKLEPEKGFNAEAGLGYRLGTLLDFNANFYYMVLTDEVYYAASGNANMEDDTRRIGGNIGVKSRPLSFLEISGGADVVNAVLLGDKEYEIPLVPAYTLYGSLSGVFPFGFELGPTLEYRGPSYQAGDVTNEKDKIDGYFLLGLSARYVLDQNKRRLALQCTVKNLLDVRHTSNVYWGTYYPGDGRSVNVSLQYRF